MVPLNVLLCPLFAITITAMYAAWHRAQLAHNRGPHRVLRDRVAYLLWVTADRA